MLVKSTWWAAAAQPVLLGFGAILTALNLNEVLDNVKPIEIRNWLPLADKEADKETDKEEKKKKKARLKTNKETIERDDWMYVKPPLSKS